MIFRKLTLSILLLVLASTILYAQKKLTDSRTSGYYTYIYKLTDTETFQIAAKSKSVINDGFMHTLIDSFYNAGNKPYTKKLPFGNYLYVNAVKNQLSYRLVPNNNVNLKFIANRTDYPFAVVDLKGNLISGPVVTVGKNKRVRYDAESKLYITGRLRKEAVLTVKHEGVNNYFTFEEEKIEKPSRRDRYTQVDFNQDQKKMLNYQGYMVFNKPKYKPLDTVKFKAYMVTAKGKILKDKPMRVDLRAEYDDGPWKTLTMLNPYHEGGYEYSFVLADSLDLDLDSRYNIALFEKMGKEWKEAIRKPFTYEDYELKSVNFSIRSDKDEHSPGSPVTIYLKASDENELAVPDGRVELVVNVRNVEKYHAEKVFVKDSLWTKSFNLDPVGETKLVLPDSIFPNANLDFIVHADFFNSNNERRQASKYLKFTVHGEQIKTKFIKDSLQIDYLFKGISTAQKATVITSFTDSEETDSMQVLLPAKIKMDYRISEYTIKTASGLKHDVYLEDLNPNVTVSALQGKDSLQIVVDNQHKIPFWYTIISGGKILKRAYVGKLDTTIKHAGSKPATIKIDYLWDDEKRSTETTSFYSPQFLNVKLLAPEIVYPGQKVDMQVKVTDVNDQPSVGTDVTAYAFTSKFSSADEIYVPNFGKPYKEQPRKPDADLEDVGTSGQIQLNWNKWGKELGLDTIGYYQFTQTKDLFAIQETITDTMAVVAPFVVSKGAILPVHILYIDEVPVFFNQAEQLQRYAFTITPGRHNIRMRTQDYMISIQDYTFQKGKKTILSVLAALTNEKVKVTAAPSTLTDYEAGLLSKYMIRIQDNFGGDKATIKTDDTESLLNPPPNTNRNKDLLIGPFKENYLNINFGKLNQSFFREPDYTYTFSPNLLKQKSYATKYGFSPLLITTNTTWDDYKQNPLKTGEIDSIWTDYLDLRSHTTSLFNNYGNYSYANGKLVMKLDSGIIKTMLFVKNIIIYKDDEPDFLQIYPGNSGYFNSLEAGKYKIIYLFKDNRYFVAENTTIMPRGTNYFQWKDMKIRPADSLSVKLDRQIKSIAIGNTSSGVVKEQITENLNERYFDASHFVNIMKGRVLDEDKTPIPGAAIGLKGANYRITSDKDGYFEIKVPKKGKLVITYIGYFSTEINTSNGNAGDIILKASHMSLDEVVVVGYGVVKKASMTGSVVTSNALAGRVAGINIQGAPGNGQNIFIRGLNSLPENSKALIIVDGLPYDKDLSSLSPDLIAELNILKDKDATAIYGSRGANGVILIKTKGGNLQQATPLEGQSQQSTMRTNFSDYAFWQPKLITNEEGRASFTVKFPDDITSWSTKLIAMNGRKQSGLSQTTIKSFKTLSANFVSPLFAIAGDSINVIGKLMNYSNMEEKVIRKFSYNEEALRNSNVAFKNAHIDTISIVAAGINKTENDSLKFEYTMKQENGYFDGEIRKIPLFRAGVTETKGFFNAMTRDTTITYKFSPELGKVTLRAEASVFPTLLDEIDKLRRYEYFCNEQLASKLKALLIEKTVRHYLKQEFKEEKNIKDLLKKLQSNRRPEGTWGWWQNSNEEIWISLHVVETLLEAQKQGYTINLDKDKLYAYLVSKLANRIDFDQIYAIRLIRMLNENYFIKDWVQALEKQRAEFRKTNPKFEQPLYEKLQIMQLRQMAAMPVDINWLLSIKKETMFGNIYWGDQNSRFWDNSIQNTLLAYQILRTAGNHKTELDAILRYFLEQRRDGQWRNTYESSLILKTILPELIIEGKTQEPAALSINNTETITKFPYTSVVEPAKSLTISKKGDAPVYFTAYQQFNNPKPEKVSKDFTVKTSFLQKQTEVTNLKPGQLTTLKVEVEVRADADYVMIEIPIPAGCSYENKMQSFWGVETHREYFKHKTSIFCTKLKQGKYTFNIELMPRYSGNYILNPAKAEMMYFPVFYGREGMKRIGIR